MSTIRAMATALAAVFILSCNPTNPKIAFKHAERRGRLESNGLRFVIMPDPNTNLVQVDVRYEVGSAEDPIGKAGLAHLAEHMMFQQKPDGPNTKPLFNYLLQTSVFVNAFTSHDQTHYMVNVRADQLDDAIKIEALRMHYGCETITEEEFLRERDVVRNEIRGGFRRPDGLIYPLTLRSIYPKGHPYHETVGGNDEQLTNITFKDACDFLRNYYVPERATVIVAGGVDVDETIKSITKWFGKLEKRKPGPRRQVSLAPEVHKAQRKVFDVDLERPWLVVAWPLPDSTTPKGELVQFGIWSAFFDAAVKADEYECATQTEPFPLGGALAPSFGIAMELKGMDRVDECLDFIWKAAKKAHRGWDYGTWEQLEESKNRRKASFISSLESLSGRTVQMGELVQFTRDFDFDSSGLYLFHELDKIGKFDQEAVGKAMKGLLDPERAHVLVFKPNKEGLKGDRRSKVKFEVKSHTDQREEPELDPSEAKRPLKVAAELKQLAGAKRFTLGNGMRVVLLPIDAFPVISGQIVFDVGSAMAPDNPWLAPAAADFLQQNIEAEATRRTGVSMRCRAGADFTSCYARGMNIYLDVVVKGLERLIRAGEYNQEAVENWQKSVRLGAKLRRPQQRREFSRQLAAAIYGPEHPYTLTASPGPDAVGKVGRDALDAFRDKHYSAANATLVLVGHFDPAAAEALIRSNFGEWGRGHKDQPISREPYKRTGPQYVGVIGDDDPQVDVAIAYPAPAGIDGQEAARLVLTEMLNDKVWEIRSKLGSTYGTYARRATRVGPTAYHIGGSIDAPRAGESIRAMRDGIDSFRRGEDFDLSFARARRKVLKDLLGVSTVTSELADQLATVEAYKLDPNHYNNLLQQVAAVSTAQVRALIAKELDPANEVMVLLGDRTHVTKAFDQAGIKDVKLVEPDYR